MWAYGIIYLQRMSFIFDGVVSFMLIFIQLLLEVEINKENETQQTSELLWVFSRGNDLKTIQLY